MPSPAEVVHRFEWFQLVFMIYAKYRHVSSPVYTVVADEAVNSGLAIVHNLATDNTEARL